jgi:hypothetical protein
MDDTPKAFLEEIRTSILRKRVGQIALAVVIAQAIWRLVNALTWYLLVPTAARMLDGNTESGAFQKLFSGAISLGEPGRIRRRICVYSNCGFLSQSLDSSETCSAGSGEAGIHAGGRSDLSCSNKCKISS